MGIGRAKACKHGNFGDVCYICTLEAKVANFEDRLSDIEAHVYGPGMAVMIKSDKTEETLGPEPEEVSAEDGDAAAGE